MMKLRIAAFLALVACPALAPAAARAQLTVVSACNLQTLTVGKKVGIQYITAGGLLCVSSSGGGGGGSVTQGTTPWVDDITQWANVALGAPSNYGTSPGAVAVPGINAYVTGGTIGNTPTTGTPTEVTVTCGTSATTLLAASTATTFVAAQNPNGVANTVWVNYAGASAVAAPPSFSIASGVTQVWSTLQGYVPTSGISCISSPGAQAVTLSYK